MDKTYFWHKGNNFAEALFQTTCSLSDNSYLWITDLEADKSWIPQSTQKYFGLDTTIYKGFHNIIGSFVHPQDQEEFFDSMSRRLYGEGLSDELNVRMRSAVNDYNLYCFRTDIVYGEDQSPKYMITVFNNINVFPMVDALTYLYSYMKYTKDIEQVVKEYQKVAVLKIKIEGFNNLAMIYGNAFADELLKTIAFEFIYMMDAYTAVYKFDGEKFMFILKKYGRSGLLDFEQRVRRKLEDGIVINNKHISLKISSGAILLDNFDGDASSISSMVSYALSHSVNAHQGQLIIFNDEVRTPANSGLELMRVIHESVRNNCKGFYVEYQPIVSSASGKIMGVETLVRWKQEPFGIVPPGMFIEWMETDPIMYDLGNFVLKTSLSETRQFLDIYPDFFVNVNLSAKQLENPAFRQAVLDILEETGFPGRNLCLELTERCKDFPIEMLKADIEFFHSHGIKLAMDDYGTGSASSSIVMNAPVDEIKIDMSFIRDIAENPKNQAMVKSIVDFANSSGINTCLEGVENEELQNYLRDYNATWFQGYYYSRPVSLDKIHQMLLESNAREEKSKT